VLKESIAIPIAVKLSPFYSALPHLAAQLDHIGADGLVLFNRFVQPDIDLETLDVGTTLHLSTSEELLLGLRWIAILFGRVSASLAATTGVHTAEDALKMLLAGADVTMMASALFRNGPEHLALVRDGIATWLTEHDYASVEQLKGSVSQRSVDDPVAFARSNYMQMLVDYTSPYDWRGSPGSVRT
jgi:dihydroorotate dehydrogenase (fumarate)